MILKLVQRQEFTATTYPRVIRILKVLSLHRSSERGEMRVLRRAGDAGSQSVQQHVSARAAPRRDGNLRPNSIVLVDYTCQYSGGGGFPARPQQCRVPEHQPISASERQVSNPPDSALMSQTMISGHGLHSVG